MAQHNHHHVDDDCNSCVCPYDTSNWVIFFVPCAVFDFVSSNKKKWARKLLHKCSTQQTTKNMRGKKNRNVLLNQSSDENRMNCFLRLQILFSIWMYFFFFVSIHYENQWQTELLYMLYWFCANSTALSMIAKKSDQSICLYTIFTVWFVRMQFSCRWFQSQNANNMHCSLFVFMNIWKCISLILNLRHIYLCWLLEVE